MCYLCDSPIGQANDVALLARKLPRTNEGTEK